MSNIDPFVPIPELFCKLCGVPIKPKDFDQYNLAQKGIIIAQCPQLHYTIHKTLPCDELVEFSHWFTDFIFINGFEVQRSQEETGQTTVWYGEHKQLEHYDRAITDEEFVALFVKYERFGPMK